MIYNTTIFEKKSKIFFLGDQRSKAKFYPSPTQTPEYDSVYPRFSDSFRTTLASSGGFVSQLEIWQGLDHKYFCFLLEYCYLFPILFWTNISMIPILKVAVSRYKESKIVDGYK